MDCRTMKSSPAKRSLGETGLDVSEIGFGAWPIGGTGYGPVDEKAATRCIAGLCAGQAEAAEQVPEGTGGGVRAACPKARTTTTSFPE